MTVIQPNSVSGINSITVQNGNSLSVHKADGSLIRTITGATGLSTFATASVGTGWTDFSAGGGINIGLGASISNGSGNVLTFGTGGDDRATIDSSGNAKFISNARQVIIQNGGTSGQPEIAFRNAADDGDAAGNIDGATLDFRIAGTSKLNIDGSGVTNVTGILKVDSGSAGQIDFGDITTAYGRLYADSNGTSIGSKSNHDLLLKSNDLERLRINTVGDALLGAHGSRIFDDTSGTNVVVDVYGGTTAGKRGILSLSGRTGSDDADLGTIWFANENNTQAGTAAHNASKLVASIDVKSETTDSNAGSDSGGHMLFSTKAEAGQIGERLRITSDGRLVVGHTASEAMFYTGRVQVQGTSSGTSAITVKTNQNDSGGPAIVLGKSRGAVGGTTVVQNNDELGTIYFAGADGTDTNSRAAAIRCQVDGGPGGNDMPGRLIFMTTADGASTETERMRLDSQGNVLIGNLASGSANRTGVLVVETNNYNGIQVVRNSADASTPLLSLSKTRGTSSGAVTAVNNGDICGRIRFQGADGDELSDAAYIDCKIDAAPGNNDMAGRLMFYTSADGSSSPTSRLEINKDGYVYVKTGNLDVQSGTISDAKGDVRKSYKNEQGSTYTLVAADASKVIGAQNTVTVPASVFANGDMVSIVNYTGGNITITQGSGLTIYNTGDASTGNRTLATRGMATLWFPTGTTAYISGTGLS